MRLASPAILGQQLPFDAEFNPVTAMAAALMEGYGMDSRSAQVRAASVWLASPTTSPARRQLAEATTSSSILATLHQSAHGPRGCCHAWTVRALHQVVSAVGGDID